MHKRRMPSFYLFDEAIVLLLICDALGVCEADFWWGKSCDKDSISILDLGVAHMVNTSNCLGLGGFSKMERITSLLSVHIVVAS